MDTFILNDADSASTETVTFKITHPWIRIYCTVCMNRDVDTEISRKNTVLDFYFVLSFRHFSMDRDRLIRISCLPVTSIGTKGTPLLRI